MSLTVGKLKLMLERLLRIKAAQQALLLVPPEGSGAQVCGVGCGCGGPAQGGEGSGGVRCAGSPPCRLPAVRACCGACALPPRRPCLDPRSMPSSQQLQPEDITDDDGRELRYYDVCDGCRCAAVAMSACVLSRLLRGRASLARAVAQPLPCLRARDFCP